MAKGRGGPAQAAAREIGRVTLLRLTGYYLVAGVLLLCLSALLPQDAIAPMQAQPPADMEGAVAWFRNQVAIFPTGAPRWLDALLQMTAAFLLVLPLAFVYVRTRTRIKFDHSLVQTVIVLPIVVTAILVVVRDSLALAFSLAGIVAAVRFRNNLKESGDAVYIFGSIGIGFATGIHAISVATVLSIVFVVVELALWKFDFSAEFERTFARLCLPSGADLAPLDTPAAQVRGPRGEWGRCGGGRPERDAPDLRGSGGCGAPRHRGGARARRQALESGAGGVRERRTAGAALQGAGAEERGGGTPARTPAAGRCPACRRRRRRRLERLTRFCHCASGSRARSG